MIIFNKSCTINFYKSQTITSREHEYFFLLVFVTCYYYWKWTAYWTAVEKKKFSPSRPDTHRERLVFHSIQYRNGWLAASDLFDIFTQSIKFYTFHCHYRCLKNVIHQIDSKNGWFLLSASFTAKFGFAFVLTLKNTFS